MQGVLQGPPPLQWVYSIPAFCRGQVKRRAPAVQTLPRDHPTPELGYMLLYTFAYTFLKSIFQGHNGFRKYQRHQNMLKPWVKASAPK